MTESTGEGPHVDASRDQLRGGVVPELVDVHVPADPRAHPLVALADCVGLDPGRCVEQRRADARRTGMSSNPARSAMPPVGDQERDRLRVDPSLPVSLGVLLPRAPAALSDTRRDDENCCPGVEPVQRGTHTSPRRAPVVVDPAQRHVADQRSDVVAHKPWSLSSVVSSTPSISRCRSSTGLTVARVRGLRCSSTFDGKRAPSRLPSPPPDRAG